MSQTDRTHSPEAVCLEWHGMQRRANSGSAGKAGRVPGTGSRVLALAAVLASCLGGSCSPSSLVPSDTDEQVQGFQPEPPPASSFTASDLRVVATAMGDGLMIQYAAATVDGQALPDGQYTWDFGDGATGEGPQVSHTYKTAGVYAVSLCVTIGVGTTAYYLCTDHEQSVVESAQASALEVSPETGLESYGNQGGPFTPRGMTYTLTNAGTGVLNWSASKGQSWLLMDKSSGSLLPGERDQLTIWIGTIEASSLPPGTYTDFLDIVDNTSVSPTAKTGGGKGGGRPIKLSVSPPVVPDQFASTPGLPTTLTLQGSDPNGKDLTFAVVGGPSHGTLGPIDNSAISSATVLYTPVTGYVGTDTFTFNASNGSSTSKNATFTITITAPGDLAVSPAGGLTASGTEGGPFMPGSITYTLVNAGGSPLNWRAAKNQAWVALSKAGGTLAPGASETITVSLAAESLTAGSYSDTVLFSNVDNATDETTAPVAVEIAPRSPEPTSFLVSGRVSSGVGGVTGVAGVTLDAGTGVTAAISDANGNYQLTVPSGWSGTVTPQHSGYTFTPPSRSYTSVAADQATQDFAATASTVNSPPVATAQSVIAVQNTPVTITLTGSDPQGLPLTFSIATPPSHGSLGAVTAASASSASVVYTPSTGYVGSDAFAFRVNNGVNDSPAGTVSITVNAVNTAPTVASASVSTNEDSAKVITLSGSDVEGSDLTFSIAAQPSHGTLGAIDNSAVSTATVTYTPAANYSGPDSFTFWARDGQLNSANATLSVTVNPVNDAPSFTCPVNQSVALGGSVQVSITNVSAGPSDESGQSVTVTAASNNQSVVPNANLALSGSPPTMTLSITGAANGSAQITLTATDTGGTANGGVNQAACSFNVNVVSGPSISGQITLVETVGHRPPIGQQDLAFTGTGSWSGTNFVATTDVQGTFSQTVPEGWTGTISPADPGRMVFLDPVTKGGYDQSGLDVSSRAITTPVPAGGLPGQNIVVWTAPIGIPMPEFGIRETHHMYVGKRFDFDGDGTLEPGEEYRDAGSGPYTHYVDNTHPSATDTGNPFGSPEKPRKTIPAAAAAGSVVEIHGGPYNYTADGVGIVANGSGSAIQPVFIRGADPTNRTILYRRLKIAGTYTVTENLDVDGTSVTGSLGAVIVPPTTFCALRHFEFRNNPTGSGAGIATVGYASHGDQRVEAILVYNCRVRDIGPSDSNTDIDFHGISASDRSRQIWFMDNEVYHTSGSGIGASGSDDLSIAPNHVFIGRNHIHHTRQAGAFLKGSSDIIISSNRIHDVIATEWSPSKGIGQQYNAQRAWMLCNEIYNCWFGVRLGSGTGTNTDRHSYILGNLIHDIRFDGKGVEASYNPATGVWVGGAFLFSPHSVMDVHNNTVCRSVQGVYDWTQNEPKYISNNIFRDVEGYTLYYEYGSSANAGLLTHNLFDMGARLRWAGATFQGLDSFRAAYPDQGEACVESDPRFVDAIGGDYHLRSDSPARDTGTALDAYNAFRNLYGFDIQSDIEGKPRPMGGAWDIGSFEY